jgi:hypothetical protein
MKRLIGVVTLILCLSFPVFSGHTQTGFGRQCECNLVNNVCPCCGASFLSVANDQENNLATQHDADGAEFRVIRLAVLMWLKLRA